MPVIGPLTAYTEDYKQICFQLWVANGYPEMEALARIVPPDVDGRTVKTQTLNDWKRNYRWEDDKEIIEAKAQDIVYTGLAEQRAEMYKRQASMAKELGKKSIDYLSGHEFENTTAALKALQFATQLEKESLGVGGGLVNIVNMTNENVSKELVELLGRLTPEQVDALSVKDVTDGISDTETTNG